MGRSSRPGWWAARAVGVAASALPAGERRDRYRQEFLAELYGLSPGARARHAVGLVAQALALRSALAAHHPDVPTSTESLMYTITRVWGRVLCALNQHRWQVFQNDDNDVYHRCLRCRRDLYVPPYPGGGAVSGPGVSFGP